MRSQIRPSRIFPRAIRNCVKAPRAPQKTRNRKVATGHAVQMISMSAICCSSMRLQAYTNRRKKSAGARARQLVDLFQRPRNCSGQGYRRLRTPHGIGRSASCRHRPRASLVTCSNPAVGCVVRIIFRPTEQTTSIGKSEDDVSSLLREPGREEPWPDGGRRRPIHRAGPS